MPIGRFGKACRLSVKSLRNYDASGLLPASFVDPRSGYRYYRLEQLARANGIRSLRLVEMPLDRIKAVLDGADSDALLRAHLAELLGQQEEYARMVHELRHLISRRTSRCRTT